MKDLYTTREDFVAKQLEGLVEIGVDEARAVSIISTACDAWEKAHRDVIQLAETHNDHDQCIILGIVGMLFHDFGIGTRELMSLAIIKEAQDRGGTREVARVMAVCAAASLKERKNR